LTTLFDELVAPIGHGQHRNLVAFIRGLAVFWDRRIFYRETLRTFYQALHVTGDAIPEAAIGRLIDLPMGRHAQANDFFDNMLARPRTIAVGDQQDVSILSVVAGPPAAGAVADARVDPLPDYDGLDDNAEDNTVARVRHDWSRDARVQPADNDRSIESVLGPPPVDNRALGLSDESIQTFTDPQGVSLSDGSAEASQEKKKARKK
jgi:hypothetical protein